MKTIQLILEFAINVILVSSKSINYTVSNDLIHNTASWDALNHNKTGFNTTTVKQMYTMTIPELLFKLTQSYVKQKLPVKTKTSVPEVKTSNIYLTTTTEDIKYVNMKRKCPKFTNSKTKFNIDAMPDIWQIAYYDYPDPMDCFKIHIRKVSLKEKFMNEVKYGNFSGRVNWTKCNLEIRAAKEIHRFHYLQGDKNDYGVLENVIINSTAASETTASSKVKPIYTLVDEGPDQWLPLENLLLMRDCNTGNIVVYSRIPWQPGQDDIKFALGEWGEGELAMNAKMACHTEENYEEYENVSVLLSS